MSFAETIFPWLLKMRRADGELVDGQCDQAGNLRVAVVASTDTTSFWVDPEAGAHLVASRLIASQAGRRLFRVLVVNEGAERRWFMLFDLPRLASDGAQPFFARPVSAGEFFEIGFPRPRILRSGLAWGVSTAPDLLAADAAGRFRVSLELE